MHSVPKFADRQLEHFTSVLLFSSSSFSDMKTPGFKRLLASVSGIKHVADTLKKISNHTFMAVYKQHSYNIIPSLQSHIHSSLWVCRILPLSAKLQNNWQFWWVGLVVSVLCSSCFCFGVFVLVWFLFGFVCGFFLMPA